MSRRLRKVYTSIIEHSSVSYAKMATIGGFCNVDHILVKATSPDDFPLPDKYVHQLLKIFTISPTSGRAFSVSFSRRFGRTRNWRVALKCLLLLHRLLRSMPENSPFRSELLWKRSNGFMTLYPCRFQDDSSSNPETFTTFIRSYAYLLDEALCGFYLDGDVLIYEEDLEKQESLADKRKEIARLLDVLPQLQSLIDRVMDCRPTGNAAKSFLIQSAMKYIIRDSFLCYSMFRQDVVLVLDNLFQMPYRSCIAAFGIYKKAALQASQLWEFYEWCRLMGFVGCYEYPLVDRIPQLQIQALENFINGMWPLTSSLSSSPSSSSSSVIDESRSSFTEDDRTRKYEGDEEREPLIKLDDDENDNWEDLLEASVNFCHEQGKNLLLFSDNNGRFSCSNGNEKDEWKIQVYNSNESDPFNQFSSNIPICHAEYASSDPKYPWGL